MAIAIFTALLPAVIWWTPDSSPPFCMMSYNGMKFNEEEPVQYATVGCALCGLAIIQNVGILPFIHEIAHHPSIKSHGDSALSGWREVLQ